MKSKKLSRRGFLGATVAGMVFSSPAENSAENRTEKTTLLEPMPESRLPHTLPLNGNWWFRPDEAGTGLSAQWAVTPISPDTKDWTAAPIPGCWEKEGVRATLTGPVWYRKTVPLPKTPGRLWWECDAVSYYADGYANGSKVGTHTGMWDSFAWEISADVLPGEGALELALLVEKPGSKRFPVKQTLAGFLPYVWGTWGGIWQDTRLRVTGACRIAGVVARGNATGVLVVETELDLLAGTATRLQFAVQDQDGKVVATGSAQAESSTAKVGTVKTSLTIPQVRLWEPDSPNLYTLMVTALVGDAVSDVLEKKVGFREVQVREEVVLLNGRPVYFRAPLSWGWYEAARIPNPSPEEFRKELQAVRELGFNGMKFCLWIPPRHCFDIADEMGMLLWVELPLWLPEITEANRAQIPQEYRRIVHQIADHPSILLWTVGCEIGKGVEASLMAELYSIVKEEAQSPLVRDNSGSAECYGGPLPEYADYWDFHLYCDLPFARVTFDAFAPRWRETQPFLFGEFNDQDALRDLPRILKDRQAVPWWTKADTNENPQGVRWEYAVTTQMQTLTANALLERTDELRESSRLQALLSRKYTLELTRSYPFTGGYVVTGLADTPISTAGIFDDFGKARFTPEEFTSFNADTVLFMEPDRRRAWTAGGDRPSWLDRYGVWTGEIVRRHIGISHFGRFTGNSTLRWEARSGSHSVAKGETAIRELNTGDVREIALLEFATPQVNRPVRLEITATLALGAQEVQNRWSVWVYPKPSKETTRRIGLFDPAGQFAGIDEAIGLAMTPLAAVDGSPTDGKGFVPLIVTTAWRPTLCDYIASGGRVLLVQPRASVQTIGDGLPAEPMPFWREAMRLFEPHPSWGAFPHEKHTNFCFYGLASDCAFDIPKVQAILGQEAILEPVLTRVDARSSALHGYIMAGRLGSGAFLLTTLRPHGGLGDQPTGLSRHITGAWLLRQWVDWLNRG